MARKKRTRKKKGVAGKMTPAKALRLHIRRMGDILPHGYEIRKAKRRKRK
jgi:hypothetical protein